MKLNDYLTHANLKLDANSVLAIQNRLKIGEQEIHCRINLVLEEPGLSTLLAACGL